MSSQATQKRVLVVVVKAELTRARVVEGLGRAYPDHYPLDPSTWLVYTDKAPKEVRDHLWQLTSTPADTVFVCTFQEPAAWAGAGGPGGVELMKWLVARLPGRKAPDVETPHP